MFPLGPVENRNLPGPGVNGFSSSNVTPPSVNVRPQVRPNLQGQSFMNGPSGGPPSSQMNQPNMAMNQGQFRPAHPPPSGRPSRPPGMTGFAPPGQSGMRGPLPPNQMPGQFGMPARPVVPPVSQPRETNSAPTSEGERILSYQKIYMISNSNAKFMLKAWMPKCLSLYCVQKLL